MAFNYMGNYGQRQGWAIPTFNIGGGGFGGNDWSNYWSNYANSGYTGFGNNPYNNMPQTSPAPNMQNYFAFNNQNAYQNSFTPANFWQVDNTIANRPNTQAGTQETTFNADAAGQIGGMAPNYANVNFNNQTAQGTAQSNLPYVQTDQPLQLAGGIKQAGVGDVSNQQFSAFGDVSSLDLINMTPDQRQEALLTQLGQQAGQQTGIGTYGLTEQQTQRLLMDPNMGYDPRANIGTRLEDYDLRQAQAMEAAREGMADVAGRGMVEDQLMGAALSGAQGRTMTRADLEDRAAMLEQQNFANALNQGRQTAGLGSQMQQAVVGNLIGAAGAFDPAMNRQLQEQTTEAELGFNKSAIVSDQMFDSTMSALDRIQQLNLTGLQGSNALMLEDARSKFEAGNLDAQLDFQGMSDAINRDLQVALQNGDWQQAAMLQQQKGVIDASIADMRTNADLAMQNRQLNSTEAIANMQNDTDKWRTELQAVLEKSGMESDEAMFQANLQVDATNAMLERELNSEIAEGNIDVQMAELAQDSWKFQNRQEFEAAALQAGFTADEAARAWESGESAKDRALNYDMQTRTQEYQAEQNRLDRFAQKAIADSANATTLRVAGMDNEARLAIASLNDQLQRDGMTLDMVSNMFEQMGPEGAEMQGEWLRQYAQENGIEIPSARDATEVAYIKSQLGNNTPARGNEESLADYANRLREVASQAGLRYGDQELTNFTEQMEENSKIKNITWESITSGQTPIEALRGNPLEGGVYGDVYNDIVEKAPPLPFGRDKKKGYLSQFNSENIGKPFSYNGRLVRVTDKSRKDTTGLFESDVDVITLEDVATGETKKFSARGKDTKGAATLTDSKVKSWINGIVKQQGMTQSQEDFDFSSMVDAQYIS